MSIASDIMKESVEGMGSPKTKADFAEKRASEVAVKQELSDEESTYYFDDGSLLLVHAEGTMLSGFYKVALPEFKVGQMWKTRTGAVRISVVYPSGHVLCSDNVKRNPHGRVSIYPDKANDHTGDLIELVAPTPLASPPLLLPDAEGVYFANDGKERNWTHAEQIEEFRTLHAALLKRGDAPVPFPSIVVHSHGERLSIYGLNGEDIAHHPITHLEGMKAATGYPVYVRHECKFSALTFDIYEVQS